MVKRKVKVTWLATDELATNDCWQGEFPTKKEAERGLIEHQTKIELERLRKIFRKYFKVEEYSSKYQIRCVDCDILLDAWEMEVSCYDNDRGNHSHHIDSKKIFDGHRCLTCHEKALKLHQKMVDFHLKTQKTKFIIDIDCYTRLRNKTDGQKLNIFKVIENWDKNKKGKR